MDAEVDFVRNHDVESLCGKADGCTFRRHMDGRVRRVLGSFRTAHFLHDPIRPGDLALAVPVLLLSALSGDIWSQHVASLRETSCLHRLRSSTGQSASVPC